MANKKTPRRYRGKWNSRQTIGASRNIVDEHNPGFYPDEIEF